jgi:hypothetical protein
MGVSPPNGAAIDPDRIRVEPLSRRAERIAPAVHCFQVLFGSRSGRCFITELEAEKLNDLNPAWVKRALLNLAARRGRGWLEDALVGGRGLRLNHTDALEPWPKEGGGHER